MTRADNILFALYAHRLQLLDLEQFLAICGSLRHGKDIDIGISLAKRGVIDEQQMNALWTLVTAQSEAAGGAKKVLRAFEAGRVVEEAIQVAIKPQPLTEREKELEIDPPTVKFPPRKT